VEIDVDIACVGLKEIVVLEIRYLRFSVVEIIGLLGDKSGPHVGWIFSACDWPSEYICTQCLAVRVLALTLN